MLITGVSWVKLGEIVNINLDLVRKKIMEPNKWVSSDIFKKTYKIMLLLFSDKL